ncbi:MAG: YfbK domain-containing protein [Candidatus Eremiobacterota bacterium]
MPLERGHEILAIGVQGRRVPMPPRNLVFLVDVSGSMADRDKLPLLKSALLELVATLGAADRVAIVVYAGQTDVALRPTPGSRRGEIRAALEGLRASGATNGGEGIRLAYRVARQGFRPDGVNRVILCSDGDFNAGVTDRDKLQRLIQENRRSGVFLTVLGFGSGNLNDATMETLADRGDGNYAYVDSLTEARKALGPGSLVTIARDVKIQVEFEPSAVASYRLLGYDNRALEEGAFGNDRVDAGEAGSGQSVTALYELVPTGRGGRPGQMSLGYKPPSGSARARLLKAPLPERVKTFERASENTRFACSVAAFGMVLRGSEHRGDASLERVSRWASSALGEDSHGHRREFLELVSLASSAVPSR